MLNYQMLIGGQWCEAMSAERIESIDPYSTKPWSTIPRGGAEDAKAAIDAAHAAFKDGPWSQMNPTVRGALIRKLADLIVRDADKLAGIEVQDNGKLLVEMTAQLRYVPQWYYYYAGLADKVEGHVLPIDRPGMMSYVRYEPVGVVVGITPWNSPLMLTACKLAPALAAGCTVVLKPSEHTSASTLEFVKLFEEAGFPPGVVNVVTGYGSELGEALVGDRRVRKIAFTGGEQGGRQVAMRAAQDFKHVTLELGGKSPNIVFDDADLDNAVKGAISGIFAATGQTCIAGSRLLVQDSIYDSFLARVVDFARQARIGDPRDPDTQVGPMTTTVQLEKVLEYIGIAQSEGARCVLGGKRLGEDNWFIEPTIFADVTNDMRIAQEEVFGPVLSVIRFKDEDDAIRIANDSLYGLACGIWTQSMNRAFKVAHAIEAGTVWVNTYRVASVMAPFGGFKQSGLGRENGIEAIYNYLETKTVWINYENDVPNPFVMRI